MKIEWIDKITDTKNNDVSDYSLVFLGVFIILIMPTILACLEFGWGGLFWPVMVFMAWCGGTGAGKNRCR